MAFSHIARLALLALACTQVVSAVPKKHNTSPVGSSPLAKGPTPSCTSTTPFLIFDPPTLQMNDNSFDAPFSVRLAKKPESEVTVFLDGKGMSFEKNTLVFNPADWNKPQTLHVVSTPDFYEDQKDADIEVVATVDAPCEPYVGCKQGYEGKRYKFPGGTCTISGDPHFVTFNGLKVDHQGKGIFHLVDSDWLSIQSYQYPCLITPESKATCIGAIAIRYGESAAVISVAKKGEYDKTDLKKYDLEGMDYTPRDKDASDKWEFKLDDGSTITVNVGEMKGVSWLDVNILLQAGYYGKVGGLCNVQEKKYDKQLLCSNGKVLSHKNSKDVNEWGDSWMVKDDSNMFKGTYKVGWKKFPLKRTTTYKSCPAKTTTSKADATTVATTAVTTIQTTVAPTVITTSTVQTIPVVTTIPAITTSVAPVTSTSIVYASSGTTVIASTVTSVAPASTTTIAAITTTIYTTTTIPVVYTTTTTSTVPVVITSVVAPTTVPTIPALTTTTTTKTTCTLPRYTPDEYTYQVPTPTSTVPPIITSSIFAIKTTTPAPTYTTIPMSPEYEDDDDEDDEDSEPSGYIVPKPWDYKPPAPVDIKTAEDTCKKILTIPGCEKICPKHLRSKIHTCVTDVLTTGTYAFSETTRRTLASLCEALSGYAVDSLNPVHVEAASTVRQQAGFGEHVQCVNDCSARGRCTSMGCQCVSPYTGVDCSIDKSSLPIPVALSNTVVEARQKAVAAGMDPWKAAMEVASNSSLVSNAGMTIKQFDYPKEDLPTMEETKPKPAQVATTSPGTSPSDDKVKSGASMNTIGSAGLLGVVVVLML
ncbi:hypothetical protein BC829DRAFT_405176 [Chytridium lagenaria]|nr:hypothetical protein BC829DRAFT_405176 [Chytridium lagenaria]